MPSPAQPGSGSQGLPSEPSGGEPPESTVHAELFTVSVRVKNAIAVVITAMWAGGIIADAALKDFALSPFVYSTMLGLAASIFGSSFVKGFK
jgi:hypothetical protein